MCFQTPDLSLINTSRECKITKLHYITSLHECLLDNIHRKQSVPVGRVWAPWVLVNVWSILEEGMVSFMNDFFNCMWLAMIFLYCIPHKLKSFVRQWNVIFLNGQISHLTAAEHAFQLLKTVEAEGPTNKQQVIAAALKAWRRISRKET